MKLITTLISTVAISMTVGCGSLEVKSPGDPENLPNIESQAKESLDALGVAFAQDDKAPPGAVEVSGPLTHFWVVKGKTFGSILKDGQAFIGHVAYDDPSTRGYDKPKYRKFAFKHGDYDCVKIQAWGRIVSAGRIIGVKNSWVDLSGGAYRGCGANKIKRYTVNRKLHLAKAKSISQ